MASDNVKVSIKVRPLIKREKDSKLTSQWRVRDNAIAMVDGNSDPFVFDHIFDEKVPTKQLFDTVCRPVIHSALKGINGTIFAYGQTSSGKTYTMIGDADEPGVVPLTAREIFEEIKRIKDRQFLIRVGFIEIYNEKIHDLLNTANTNLKVAESQCGDVSVNSKEYITNCPEQILQYVDAGNKARKCGETNMNERSSRSHTIFRITIESRIINTTSATVDGETDNEAVQIGILNLVDLAGSERADQTGATGSRFKEGVCINRSLLSLSCVIQKLSENSDKQFINYRDSKLTRILQASLGGNAITSMICNITPAVMDETYYTLSFAMRAKSIKNKPKVNEILTDAAMMKRLEREIKRLQSELRSEQHKNSKIKTLELQNAIILRTNQFINSQQPQSMLTDSSRRRTWCPTTTEQQRNSLQKQSSETACETPNIMGPPLCRGLSGGAPKATLSVHYDDFIPALALPVPDVCQIDYQGLFDHHDLLARKMARSISPTSNGPVNPFSATEGDEFVPGEQISFGHTSLSPFSNVKRDLHTPTCLRKQRRSSTGDSPTHYNYEARCRALEQELTELQEFTKLENIVELQSLKEDLATSEELVGTLRNEIDAKEQQMEHLDERCTHLEIELKDHKSRVAKAEEELGRARKERQSAMKEAELHRNQNTGIEYEYERFRQRAEAREKELIESLQEARSTANSQGNDSFKLDQKREEMKRLEMQNFDFTLQLEECNKQIEQLKSSHLDQHRRLEQIKQTVLQFHRPDNGDDITLLVQLIRKTLLLTDSDENGEHLPKQNGLLSPGSSTATEETKGGTDGEPTVKALLQTIEQLEETNRAHSAQELTHATEMSQVRLTLEAKIASVSQLEAEVLAWKHKFETQTTEYEELSTQMMDQMQENEVLRKDYNSLQSEAETKSEQLALEVTGLREALEQAKREAATGRSELERVDELLREQIHELQLMVENQQSLAASAETEKERLQRNCNEELARIELQKNDLDAHVKRLEQEIEAYKTDLQSARSDRDQEQRTLKDAQEECISKLKLEAEQCRAELITVQEQNKVLEAQQKLAKDQWEDAEAKLLDELETIRNQVDRLAEEKAALEKQHSDLVDEWVKVANEHAQETERRAADLTEAANQYAALEETQKAERENYETVCQKLRGELQSAGAEIERLSEEKDTLRKLESGEHESLVQRLEELKGERIALEGQLNEKEAELAKLTIELQDVRKQQEESMEECRRQCGIQREAANQTLAEELAELKLTIAGLTQEKESAERLHSERAQELTHSKDLLHGQIAEREENILRYIGELEALRTEQIQFVAQQNEAHKLLEDRNGSLEQELESLQRSVEQLMADNETLLREQLESERLVGQLERDLETVRGELERVRQDLVEAKRLHDGRAESERALAQATKEDIERLNRSIGSLENEKRRMIEVESELRQELEQQTERAQEFEERCKTLDAAREELRKENSDLTVAVQQLSAKFVGLEEQMVSSEAVQRKTIDTLERQKTALEEERKSLQLELSAAQAARTSLQADIEESRGVRDVLERELHELKADRERLDARLDTEVDRCEQEREVATRLKRELDEKRTELERLMSTGRPSLGDGRVAQALRRENEDLLRQLNEARQADGTKGKQLQERVDELQRLEVEIARLRDEMASMRHEASFNEKVDEITELQQKVQAAEKGREESTHRQQSLQRMYDQLQCKNQTLSKQIDELRRTTDKDRKSRRQSTHDDRRGLVFNQKQVGTMTDPTSTDCSCLDMAAQIKQLREALTLKECHLNTQKLMMSANPLKIEVVELRRKLDEYTRDREQVQQELNDVLSQLEKERKERKRHCTQCIRHSRQQNARCDKAVQAYQMSVTSPGPGPAGTTNKATSAVSVSIVSTSTPGGASDERRAVAELGVLQKRCDEQQEQYEQLMEKYQKMKQLCRLRNERIVSLSNGMAEKENESENVNRSMQNECVKLKQQLKEAESKYAQINRIQQLAGGRSSSVKSDVGLQTDTDSSQELMELYRTKYERYKAIAARLMEERGSLRQAAARRQTCGSSSLSSSAWSLHIYTGPKHRSTVPKTTYSQSEMSENRDEILADFQSITAIDDVSEAIFHLEECNWNLISAIQRVLPQDPSDHHQHTPPVVAAVPLSNHRPGSGSLLTHNSNTAGNRNSSSSSSSASALFGGGGAGGMYANELNHFEAVSNVEELMTAPSSPVKSNFINNSNSGSNNFDARASTSRSGSSNDFRTALNYLDTKPYDLLFKIHFKNGVHLIHISNHATIGDLKGRIFDKTSVPVCRQALKGWEPGKQKDTQNLSTPLKSLNIVGKEFNLILNDLTEEGFVGEGGSDALAVLNQQTYTLHINVQPENRLLKLNFPGQQNVLAIKSAVYTVTDIPVRHQVWSGWPSDVTNATTLAESGVGLEHNLVLNRTDDSAAKITNNNNNSSSNNNNNNGVGSSSSNYLRNVLVSAGTSGNSSGSGSRSDLRRHTFNAGGNDSLPIIAIDSESSGEEFEDASDFNNDDDIFTETPIINQQKRLIPDNTDDEAIGSIQFVENFVERYGPQHPMFFQGSLEDALKEACHRPSARDRKLLAIYLHHDGSVLTNVFCGQLLACESIVQILLDHFVLYGWDLTFESNKNMFLSSISACVGMTASITVRNIPTDRLPAILVISKNRSQCEVFQVIYGNVGVDDLLSKLMEASEMYSEQLKMELREENERHAREQVKLEQDAAYRESLEADRAKQEAKRQKEMMVQSERRRLESERAETEAKREAIRELARQTVPDEPQQNGGDSITKIRVRTPSGEMLERKFMVETRLELLLNYITAEGYLIDEFKVISSWPRRDLTTVNPDSTLKELKLYPQETLILEER
ncbi:centromere-associated protein E-like [Anopheles cruzii]|uniref:centromere-associated protein E-like n=1 Tax=Anopheles cruzii TaxID=68878 RepID=UPI0022EC3549|nr:centromere-associated protein E-like [Anopheles cruzii]